MVDLTANKRTPIKRVQIDTPALLNLVKHCREADVATAQGFLMGVSQKINHESVDSLLVTQTMPKANRAQMADLMKTLENESQRLMDTNEVGFYVNSRMGLAFSWDVLSSLLEATKKFKNSVFIVYDTSKANFGLNPLKAYRLSEKAMGALAQREGNAVMRLNLASVQEAGLTLADLYEEIPIKIMRNHMQQAYLFDYIRPEMPAFNTNLFKLAQPTYLESHVHQAAEITEQFNQESSQKVDHAFKSYQKLKKGQITNLQFKKTVSAVGEDTFRQNQLEVLLVAKQVDALCSQIADAGIVAADE